MTIRSADVCGPDSLSFLSTGALPLTPLSLDLSWMRPRIPHAELAHLHGLPIVYADACVRTGDQRTATAWLSGAERTHAVAEKVRLPIASGSLSRSLAGHKFRRLSPPLCMLLWHCSSSLPHHCRSCLHSVTPRTASSRRSTMGGTIQAADCNRTAVSRSRSRRCAVHGGAALYI